MELGWPVQVSMPVRAVTVTRQIIRHRAQPQLSCLLADSFLTCLLQQTNIASAGRGCAGMRSLRENLEASQDCMMRLSLVSVTLSDSSGLAD